MWRIAIQLTCASAIVCGCSSQTKRLSDPVITANQNLGQFTAASSFNIRGLRYETASGTKTLTEGRSCYDIGSSSPDGRLQEAMDHAIREGQKKGIDGDLLVNVRIKRQVEHKVETTEKSSWGGLVDDGKTEQNVDHQECWIVTGDLVKIVEK